MFNHEFTFYISVSNDETMFLLATCYYRAGKSKQTYTLLKKRGYNSPDLKFLFARCCIDIGEYVSTVTTLFS